IVAVALPEGMVLDVDDDVQVARRAAGRAAFPFAADAQALPGCNPCRDLDRQFALFFGTPGTPAGRAWLADDLTGAAALTARARDGEEPLLVAQLSAPMALRARRRPGAGRRPCARA